MRAVSVMMLRFDIDGTVSVVRCLNVTIKPTGTARVARIGGCAGFRRVLT
jgi:hypothetical protein